MSLEDKIKTSIERVGYFYQEYDQALCHLYGKIADFYQKKTYRERTDLVTASFITAFATAGTSFGYTGFPLDGVNACLTGALALGTPFLRGRANIFSSTSISKSFHHRYFALISPVMFTIGTIDNSDNCSNLYKVVLFSFLYEKR